MTPLATNNRLASVQIDEELARCPNWRYGPSHGGEISRRFEFENFRVAFAFMTQIAFIAEKRNHHPEWVNNYGVVEIKLTTHDAGGLSIEDIEFAIRADRVFKMLSSPSCS